MTGEAAIGGVIFGPDGKLFGTTGFSANYAGAGTVFMLTPPATAGGRWRETVLHDFRGGPGDGSRPLGGLMITQDGALYGTTTFGGASNLGTVFKLTPRPGKRRWRFDLLHSFTGSPGDGSDPIGVTAGVGGALYGITYKGGRASKGILYKLTPPVPPNRIWRMTVLHHFFRRTGEEPYSPLVADADGMLYGATTRGGSFKRGTVFQYTPPSGSGR